jgi:ribonucleotide monophosphatase NagD (HAD superfamily)
MEGGYSVDLPRTFLINGALPSQPTNQQVTVDGSEGLAIMPGTLAKWYSEMSNNGSSRQQDISGQSQDWGLVHLMGKPDPVIYQAAMARLGGLDPSRVLAIGDSLEHDVAGAQAAGIDTLFIMGGIHAEDLQLRKTPTGLDGQCQDMTVSTSGMISGHKSEFDFSDTRLQSLCRELFVTPTFVMPFLTW